MPTKIIADKTRLLVIIVKVFSIIGFSILFSFLIIFLMHRPSLKVVAQWEQPASVKYNDYSKCYLSVVESDLDWSGFPLHVGRNYFLYLGHDQGKPSYGHRINFSFHPSGDLFDDLPAFIKKSRVQWSNEGATFIEASGHRLFVPKEMFIRGR